MRLQTANHASAERGEARLLQRASDFDPEEDQVRQAASVVELELAATARERLVPDRSQSLQTFVQHLAVDINRGRRGLGDADLVTRTRVLQQLQHVSGNRAVQRLMAPQQLLAVQRCGPIPHDQCPCNDDGPAQETEAPSPAPVQRAGAGSGDQSSTATVQRQNLPGLDDLGPGPGNGAVPGADVSGPAPDGAVVPAGTSGECPPGYTMCDFLNEHISVQGQYALHRLYQRGGAQCHDAIQILSAVRSGQVQGVYKADEGKPAMLAQRNGTGWWTLHDHPSSVPKGGDAFVFEGESPPMVVFKKSIAEDREGLATALNNAWNASAIGGTELEASPPSMKSCEPGKKEEPPTECPPGTQPDPANPENCIPEKKEDECPPGTVPNPNDPDSCLLPKPGEIVLPCTDEVVFQAFQSAQDQCAQIKMGIDLLCQMGPDGCDLLPPIAKNLCKVLDPDQVKSKECKKSRPQYYADCTVGSVIGMKPTMKCNPGSGIEIFEKYKRWPGRITS